MIRIPYPIPLPARQHLIDAGREACAQHEGSNARKEAQERVEKIIAEVTDRHGRHYPDGK